jgi:O-antigen/teichoic acid export membrane protein
MTHTAFNILVGLHIVTGALSAITFWIPVIGEKGGAVHRKAGAIFVVCMLLTGFFATGLSILTLIDPMGTHPHLVGRFDENFVRAIFGWLMFHLGILTINLTWHGWLCARHKRNRDAIREWKNAALQPILLVAALNCALQGWLSGEMLLIGLAIVGVATAGTNAWFLYKPHPGPKDWLKEHLKALVGAGISVYTAFMAFGSVRLMPDLALNPVMWAMPIASGVALILWHWRAIDRQLLSHRRRPLSETR